MMIFFRDIIVFLPLLILCITTLFVLLSILFFRNHRIAFFITVFGISLSFFSLYLVWKTGIQKVMDLLYIDGFSMLCMMLVLIASLVSSIISYMWLSHYHFINNRDEFYLLLLIVTIGAMIVVNASHVVTLFFGIELISLPLFGLLGYVGMHKYSLEATLKYVLLSGISTAFLLFGIALVYLETTHLSFVDIACELVNKKASLNQSMVLMSGIAMMLVGFGFKLSLVPFHLWTADVYQGASEIAVICLASINKISIFSVLTRFFLIFPESYNKISFVLIGMSCFSVLFGNLMALKENNIKRILAYSSIAHMGYLLIGVIGSIKESFDHQYPSYILNLLTDGLTTISICLVNYLFSILGIFGILSLLCCFYDYNNNSNKDVNQENIGKLCLYRGLFWKDPILSIIFTIIILALAGIPLTLGFIGKLYLIILSLEQKLWLCVIIIILGTVIGVLYYLRMITILYVRAENIKYNNKTMLSIITNYDYNQWPIVLSGVVTLMCSVFLLILGIYPQSLIFLLSVIQEKF